MKEFSISTKIFLGKGSLACLRLIKDKRVLIITDSFIYKCGTAKRVASYLTNCKVSYFTDVVSDPPIEVISKGVRSLLDSEAEVMIAVGGGSSLDSAKVIRNMAERICPQKVQIEGCFAIPTTSGTGSEVTEFAVITDRQSQTKIPLHDVSLRPVTAVLDPSLVVSAPPSVTADTGMDALTHAIEAYVSVGASDFSDALAEKAMALIVKFLPLAFGDGSDLLAREKMHNASCMAGLAFNSAGLGLNHGIAHALGARMHLPHGRANAILLPYTIGYNADLHGCGNGIFSRASQKYQRLAKIIGLPAGSTVSGVRQLQNEVVRLNQTLKIPADLKSAGCVLTDALKDEIAEAALKDATTASNPRVPTERDVRGILDQCCG